MVAPCLLLWCPPFLSTYAYRRGYVAMSLVLLSLLLLFLCVPIALPAHLRPPLLCMCLGSYSASQYDNIYNEIKTVASADVAHRKVFVRGLAWETTTETLKDAFSTFGEVEEGAVIYDKATSKSKGFGFVTFVDMDAAQRAIAKQTVEIDVSSCCALLGIELVAETLKLQSCVHMYQ